MPQTKRNWPTVVPELGSRIPMVEPVYRGRQLARAIGDQPIAEVWVIRDGAASRFQPLTIAAASHAELAAANGAAC